MDTSFNNLFSTIKIGRNQNDQLLFGSQSYGTNYFIYGHFKLSESDENGCTITGVKMMILNYKGLLDIGFSKNPAHKTTANLVEIDGALPMVDVRITLQGAVSNDTKPDIDVDFETPIVLKGKTNLRVSRTLIPLAGKIDMHPITNGVFDNEFYYRDGWEYAKRQVRDIKDDGSNSFPVSYLDDDIAIATGPGIKCRYANFHIVYENLTS